MKAMVKNVHDEGIRGLKGGGDFFHCMRVAVYLYFTICLCLYLYMCVFSAIKNRLCSTFDMTDSLEVLTLSNYLEIRGKSSSILRFAHSCSVPFYHQKYNFDIKLYPTGLN